MKTSIKPEENWLPIPGWDGFYEVSDHGRVRSVDRIIETRTGISRKWKGKIQSLIIGYDGYMRVGLSRNNHVTHRLVHRLVAEAFIPNDGDKPEINHKNGIRSHNIASNLEWSTRKENVRHAISVLGFNPTTRPGKPILAIKGEHSLLFSSINEAMRHGFSSNAIIDCLRGNCVCYAGYNWNYKEPTVDPALGDATNMTDAAHTSR